MAGKQQSTQVQLPKRQVRVTSFEIIKAISTYYPEAKLRIVGETIEVIPPARAATAAAAPPHAAPLFASQEAEDHDSH